MNIKLLIPALVITALLASCASQPANAPRLRIVSPKPGAVVRGPKVTFEVEVQNLALAEANRPHVEGEGHLHFVIDAPNAIRAGMLVPLTEPAKFVHAGKAPYTTREIELPTGNRTVTVVVGGNDHIALASPASVSVSFIVE